MCWEATNSFCLFQSLYLTIVSLIADNVKFSQFAYIEISTFAAAATAEASPYAACSWPTIDNTKDM